MAPAPPGSCGRRRRRGGAEARAESRRGREGADVTGKRALRIQTGCRTRARRARGWGAGGGAGARGPEPGASASRGAGPVGRARADAGEAGGARPSARREWPPGPAGPHTLPTAPARGVLTQPSPAQQRRPRTRVVRPSFAGAASTGQGEAGGQRWGRSPAPGAGSRQVPRRERPLLFLFPTLGGPGTRSAPPSSHGQASGPGPRESPGLQLPLTLGGPEFSTTTHSLSPGTTRFSLSLCLPGAPMWPWRPLPWELSDHGLLWRPLLILAPAQLRDRTYTPHSWARPPVYRHSRRGLLAKARGQAAAPWTAPCVPEVVSPESTAPCREPGPQCRGTPENVSSVPTLGASRETGRSLAGRGTGY